MSDDKEHIFDNPKNIKRVLYLLYASCGVLIGLELFVIDRHTEHAWEPLWGFHAIYGFVGCVALVLIAKWMRTFLMRAEDYYDGHQSKEKEGDIHVDD